MSMDGMVNIMMHPKRWFSARSGVYRSRDMSPIEEAEEAMSTRTGVSSVSDSISRESQIGEETTTEPKTKESSQRIPSTESQDEKKSERVNATTAATTNTTASVRGMSNEVETKVSNRTSTWIGSNEDIRINPGSHMDSMNFKAKSHNVYKQIKSLAKSLRTVRRETHMFFESVIEWWHADLGYDDPILAQVAKEMAAHGESLDIKMANLGHELGMVALSFQNMSEGFQPPKQRIPIELKLKAQKLGRMLSRKKQVEDRQCVACVQCQEDLRSSGERNDENQHENDDQRLSREEHLEAIVTRLGQLHRTLVNITQAVSSFGQDVSEIFSCLEEQVKNLIPERMNNARLGVDLRNAIKKLDIDSDQTTSSVRISLNSTTSSAAETPSQASTQSAQSDAKEESKNPFEETTQADQLI